MATISAVVRALNFCRMTAQSVETSFDETLWRFPTGNGPQPATLTRFFRAASVAAGDWLDRLS
jgi:hypothetical protein